MITFGIDVGTSGLKALAQEKGCILGSRSATYPLYQSGQNSEQNPDDWLNAAYECIKGLAQEFKPEAISFSGQMHGLVVLDENDEPIRPAMLWNDGRTFAECDYLNQEIGRDVLIKHTGNIALTGFTLPKILWLKNNEPENFKRIAKIMLPKDYIAYKLTGEFATDESDAGGTLLYDVKERKWSGFMLNLAEISLKQLPRVEKSYKQIGTITKSAAKECGLPESVKIIIGGGDQAVGAVGAGVVENGFCSISLGTSGVVFVANDNFAVDESGAGIHSFAHANGAYHMMGVTLAAAGSSKWWISDILNKGYSEAQSDIKSDSLGMKRLLFLPYLSGERSPINDNDARGVLFGLHATSSQQDITQAVLEGVAFSLRHVLDIMRGLGINIINARVIGGGAKSPLWREIVANALNLRLDIINSEEGPAFGAAILAAVGAGEYKSVGEACSELVKVTDSTNPSQEIINRYNILYTQYINLYKNLKPNFIDLARASL